MAKIGVTPTRGGPIPRYILREGERSYHVSCQKEEIDYEEERGEDSYPLIPSALMVFLTTSKPPV